MCQAGSSRLYLGNQIMNMAAVPVAEELRSYIWKTGGVRAEALEIVRSCSTVSIFRFASDHLPCPSMLEAAASSRQARGHTTQLQMALPQPGRTKQT